MKNVLINNSLDEGAPVIFWSPRKNSKVIIVNGLGLGAGCLFLTLPRETVENHLSVQQRDWDLGIQKDRWSDLGIQIAFTIWRAVTHSSHSRKRDLSLLVCPGVRLKFKRFGLRGFRCFFQGFPPYQRGLDEKAKEEIVVHFRNRITLFPEIAVEIIEHLVASDQPFPWQHLERLTVATDYFLLSTQSLSFLQHPPRGQTSRLTLQIPSALYCCYELARYALQEANKKKEELANRIGRTLTKCPRATAYTRKYHFTSRAVAVALVHCKFCKNETASTSLDLLSMAPRTVFHTYGYNSGQHRKLNQLVQEAVPFFSYRSLVEGWADMFLSS